MHYLSGFKPPESWTDLAGLGLFVFAGVQLLLAAGSELIRWRERARDKKEREHIAFAALWAEYSRMWLVAQEWETRDLVVDARLGALKPSDILPRDWGASTQLFGDLGPVSAHLAAVAFMQATGAEIAASRLVGIIEAARKSLPDVPAHLPDMEVRIPKAWTKARASESLARKYARKAELTLKDAVMNSRVPGDLKKQKIRRAESPYGVVLKQRLDNGESLSDILITAATVKTDESLEAIDD